MNPEAPSPGTGDHAVFISLEAMREHWQGHRRLTRRFIEVYPEEELFRFTLGGMRPFGELLHELLRVSEPLARGVADGVWDAPNEDADVPRTKEGLLEAWDKATEDIDRAWARITPGRLTETATAFGMYEGLNRDHILYALENEIHHRGQVSVYLRALEIEPPYFWER